MAATICCCHLLSYSQNKNSVWCFGDSAGIDFGNINNPLPIATGLRTRGSCVSISDSTGSLLFYANTRAGLPSFTTTLVYDSTNNIMQNGDSIFGDGWYNELVIVPMPGNDSLYYLFCIGVTSVYGLKYSVINMNANGGLGSVIVKNIQLQSFPMIDCLNAVKHGNGRDWWVIFRRDPQFNPSNEFSTYLISPAGITDYTQQNVGGSVYANNADIAFSPTGNKVAVTSYNGLIEILNFDRCTGQLTLEHHIQTGVLVSPTPALWSVAFSPDESKLYITSSDTSTLLYQYDLTAPNIAASKDTLWLINYPTYAGGGLKLAPDNKIYSSTQYYDGFNFPYPYPDSVYNMYNMSLSVINQPDSLGAACNFTPYSFYLGGKRTYLGLPNNPDYDMPALTGSLCDSLTGIEDITGISNAELFVNYASNWQTAFINAQKIKGRSYALFVYDILGNVVFKETGRLTPPYFTKNLNCTAFAKGMYVVALTTEKEKLVKKFVKE